MNDLLRLCKVYCIKKLKVIQFFSFNQGMHMSKDSLFDKISELKEKFKNFTVHKKKLNALDNYSQVVPFRHKDYLILIKKCMADGFLGEKEAEFLCYMLEKYKLNFLDWSHKTFWLKDEMAKLSAHYNNKKDELFEQSHFDFDNLKDKKSASLPFEMMIQHQQALIGKRK
jgi:hypothetical protein